MRTPFSAKNCQEVMKQNAFWWVLICFNMFNSSDTVLLFFVVLWGQGEDRRAGGRSQKPERKVRDETEASGLDMWFVSWYSASPALVSVQYLETGEVLGPDLSQSSS